MSEGTGEGSTKRASDFQIFDSSSEGEESDIPVREITEESPYEQSENSSSVGAAAPADEGAPITVEATQEEVTRQGETTPAERSTPPRGNNSPGGNSPSRRSIPREVNWGGWVGPNFFFAPRGER